KGSIDVYLALELALARYQPVPMDDLAVLFFRADKGFFDGPNPLELPILNDFDGYDQVTPWRRWLRGPMEVVTLPCGHVSILEPPIIHQVAAHLHEALAP